MWSENFFEKMMKTSSNKPHPQNVPNHAKKTGISAWKGIAICMTIILFSWAIYVNFHPKFGGLRVDSTAENHPPSATGLGQGSQNPPAAGGSVAPPLTSLPNIPLVIRKPVERTEPVVTKTKKPKIVIPSMPVLGPIVTDGAQPLYGIKHKGTDAIFALACNYPKLYYQRFVGSLRKIGKCCSPIFYFF